MFPLREQMFEELRKASEKNAENRGLRLQTKKDSKTAERAFGSYWQQEPAFIMPRGMNGRA